MKGMALVIILGFSVAAHSAGQSLVEHAAAAAGGTVGGVAGKTASDALTNIFNKVDRATSKAAAADAPKAERRPERANAAADPSTGEEPMFEVGPGVPHSKGARNRAPSVPPPPPLAHHVSHHTRPTPERSPEPAPERLAAAAIPPPPEPQATAQDLKKIAVGMHRAELLKLGFPAIHLMMVDSGHLVETFHFTTQSSDVGLVRLTDGTVSSVQVN